MGFATSDMTVSDHEYDTATRWSELYRLLLAPGTQGYALRATRGQQPVREASGDPIELITQGEHAGAGRAVWAVVAPIRPDLLVVDLDGCADLVASRIVDSVDDSAALIAYRAASGSPDSEHLVVACPTAASRQYLLDRIDTIRTWESLSSTQLDVRTSDQFLRLPGSAPLKPGGGWCYPIDDDGRRMTAPAATRRAHRAILELPTLLSVVPAVTVADRTSRRNEHPTRVAEATASDVTQTTDFAATTSDLEQPCAWRPRRQFTSREWAVLHHTPDEGHRSHAATSAAWVLWRYGIRSWRRAASWYRTCPAFRKFADRDDHGRAHWESIKARALGHRPADPAGADHIRTVLAEIACWDDANLVAAALACIHHRFADGYGTDARPISWRDMALWLNVGHHTAGRRLRALVDRGLLVVTAIHDRASAPQSATCYSLRTPPEIYRTDLHHDVTEEGGRTKTPTLLHPIWGTLSHTAHHTWSQLSPTTALPTASIARSTGLPAGTSTHGALHLLLRLESLGLATRVGQGRGTRWLRGSRSLTAAAESCGALAHQQDLHETVTTERAAWHAPTVRSGRTIRERLRLRRRRRDSRPPDKESHAQLPFGSTFAKPMARSTSTRYRRARGSSVGSTGGGEDGKSP